LRASELITAARTIDKVMHNVSIDEQLSILVHQMLLKREINGKRTEDVTTTKIK